MNPSVPCIAPLTGEVAELFPARCHVLLARCSSTNDVARKLLLDGAEPGTLVLADAQDAGRGRRGRRWHSPPGCNIHLSLILRPTLDPAQIPLLTLVLAVAAHDAVRVFGVPAAIKWPNDLVVRGDGHPVARKLCGMVCEAVIHRGSPAVVAGIGVDVNLLHDDLPPDLGLLATSMREQVGHPLDRAEVTAEILRQFTPRYHRVLREGPFSLLPAYERRLETLGREVTVDLGDRLVRGRASSLGPGGELVVRTDGGAMETITAGDVNL